MGMLTYLSSRLQPLSQQDSFEVFLGDENVSGNHTGSMIVMHRTNIFLLFPVAAASAGNRRAGGNHTLGADRQVTTDI